MPKLGIDLKQLTREELEEYTQSLEMFASKSNNPIVKALLYSDLADISHKKRCELFKRTYLTDHNEEL